ncbi:MAG: hypothetical protein NWF14_03485 [Candidatus Bathyarchaeota archaeon]|nr:hypothetical protein [Candidatus Bathyarchaeota archaeon]
MPTRKELARQWKEDNRKRKARGKSALSWDNWYEKKFGEIPEFLKGAEKLPTESEEKDADRESFIKNTEIEQILAYVGVTQDNTSKKIAYEHWYRVIEFGIRMKGKEWQEIRSMMRSYVNVDFRYIDDYMKCLKAWKVFSVNNGILHFNGILNRSIPMS